MRKLSCKRKLSTIKSTTTILQCFCCFLLPLGQSVRELLLSLTFKCKYIQDLLGLAWGWKGGLWGSSVISFTPGSALHPTVNLAASLETKTVLFHRLFSSIHALSSPSALAPSGWSTGASRGGCVGWAHPRLPTGSSGPPCPTFVPKSFMFSSSRRVFGVWLLSPL